MKAFAAHILTVSQVCFLAKNVFQNIIIEKKTEQITMHSITRS